MLTRLNFQTSYQDTGTFLGAPSVEQHSVSMSDEITLPTPATYNRGVKALLLNRVLLILSFIGLFVAGALSMEKALNISLPCGNESGCDMVASHPSSLLFGHIPVAYIGLLGYLFFAGLAISRSLKTPYDTKLVTIGWAASAFGAAFSIWLQYISLFQIHAVCPYCLTSAITMISTFITYGLLYSAHKKDPTPETELAKLDLWMIAGIPFAIVVVLGGLGSSDKGGKALDVGSIELNEKILIPDRPNSFGPEEAPLTIVEFADMNCPSCQKTSPKVKEFAVTNPKTVRIVYRHFPLKMHKYGQVSAAMGEYAAEKGLFWDFTLSVMGLNRQPDSVDELLGIAKSLGMDPKDIKNRLSNTSDPVYDRVTRDMNAGHKVGIKATPTFIILAKGLKPDSAGPNDVIDKLNSPTYRNIILGHA